MRHPHHYKISYFDILNDKLVKKFTMIFQNYVKESVEEIGWNYDSDRVKIEAMWSIINKKGDFNIQHNHPNAYLSAAYYVKAPKDCGEIVFYDPRPAPVYSHPRAKTPNILNATINSVNPEEGLLVLFPSYLEHSVNPNQSEEQRIVISFNVRLDSKK